MIVGVGVELVDTARFEAMLDRFGDRFRRRVFTAKEQTALDASGTQRRKRGAQSLAVRFAAKLAVRRALGAGSLAWRDVEVVREGQSAPTLRLRGVAQQIARSAGVNHIALTLTHDARWCVGQVILESDT